MSFGGIDMFSFTSRNMLARVSAVCMASMIVAGAVDAATPTAAKSNYKAPRTLDGHPDLQGIWNNSTLTPFSRPAEYGDRLAMTAEDAAKIERTEAQGLEEANAPTDPSHGIQDLPTECGRGFTGVNCGYNAFWVDPGTQVMTINGEKRTSILTTPNGRVPPRKSGAASMAQRPRGGFTDGPEARPLGERCLMSFGSSAGPPMIPLLYNNNYQIVQNKDHVVILVEMVHDARIVRLNGERKPSGIRQWMGDSIGRWVGDTLVVETINLRPEQRFSGVSENVKFIERFTRTAPDKIVYEFTVEDPAVWDQPWGGQVAMNASQEPLYEYACHEGNYALPGILAGAREEERAKAAEKK